MRARLTLLAAAVGVAACSDRPSPVAAEPRTPLQVSDGAHSAGNPHFFFLPPMVANPEATGTPDPTLSAVVEVCQLAADGLACDALAPPLARFTTDPTSTSPQRPGNSETVRASEDHYIVNWHTRAFNLDPANTYRICVGVEVADGEPTVVRGLGHADVRVVETGGGKKDIDSDESFPLINGRTLPIKFRIEEGALGEEPDLACGSPT